MLKGQDIVVALVLLDEPGVAYAPLAARLGLSASAVHRAVARLATSGIVDGARRRVVRAHLLEFLVHGARYVFPAEWGGPSRGVATGVPLLTGSSVAPAWVWAVPGGAHSGTALVPLHAAAVAVSQADGRLYRRLVAVDVLRAGNATARRLAAAWLRAELSGERAST